MANFKRTETLKENLLNDYRSTWNIEYDTTDIVVSTPTFDLPPLDLWAKYTYSSKNRGYVYAAYDTYINNQNKWDSIDLGHSGRKERQEASMTSGTWYLIADSKTPDTDQIDTALFFNASNSTQRSVTFQYKLTYLYLYSQYGTSIDKYNAYTWESNGWSIFSTPPTITLDAPPLYDNIGISYNTTYIDAGITTATANISNVRAQYGGKVTSISFTIGNQTETLNSESLLGNQALSIDLNAVGTFTPTVTITDSRGQVTPYTFADITVNSYVVPTVNFTVERTKGGTNAGIPDDEGTFVTIPTVLTYDSLDGSNHLAMPTIEVDGTDSGFTTTWYSTRSTSGSNIGKLSNEISNWNNITSNTTVYALLEKTNSEFDPNKSYVISITPQDTGGHSGITQTQTLSTGFFTIDVLAGGHGISFGMPAPNEPAGFYVNMDSYIALPEYAETNTLDKQIYDIIHNTLGWDTDVIKTTR